MDKKECRTESILAFVLEGIQRSSDLRLILGCSSDSYLSLKREPFSLGFQEQERIESLICYVSSIQTLQEEEFWSCTHTVDQPVCAYVSKFLPNVPISSRAPSFFKNSRDRWLIEDDAKPRYGENLLSDKGGISAVFVLVRQIAKTLTLVLAAAMALSFGVKTRSKEPYKAEKSMDSLRSLSSPTALVVRNGATVCIPAKDVVPGDIILSVSNLDIGEALLTGEALPVSKVIDRIKPQAAPSGETVDVGVGDRINMAFASTSVTKGRGTGVVVATEDGDEVLKVPFGTTVYETVMKWLGLRFGTPLQINLSELAYVLFLYAILLAIIVFGVARFRVDNEEAIYFIALAISVIPESLIAVLTITMSTRTQRTVKTFVRTKETLTQGKMTVQTVWMPFSTVSDADSRELTVESDPETLSPEGRVLEKLNDKEVAIGPETLDEGLRELVTVASLSDSGKRPLDIIYEGVDDEKQCWDSSSSSFISFLETFPSKHRISLRLFFKADVY
ncbi:calcium ATPase [Dendrothele bispora CBS 962.96]|uniref:Calcium ATPase n=1 Tax=Dendrothele bispora (strain CBS 962.96) TaxID=1314807 RepID=A0A4S8L9Z0_DENBC|nr:calcium ATPase [Dendrothele bispora CBS 962.96]